MDRDPHWLGLRFRGSSGDDLATRVHATLAGVGHRPGPRPDKLHRLGNVRGRAGRPALRLLRSPGRPPYLGVDAGPDGSFSVDHFNCNDCALERDTSLVVCYIRPGGGALRDGY